MKLRKISIIFIIISLFYVNIVPIFASQGGRVLFISSYSFAWDSVPCQIEGIKSSLKSSTSLDIEYMDTKRFNNETTQKMFYEQLSYKLEHSDPYDVIIVGDDPALKFAMDYQEELFKDIPIIFQGINDIDTAKKASQNPYMTGIVEELSYHDNIDYAKKIFPQAKKIVAICDDTITGQGERKQFFENAKDYPDMDFSEINVFLLTEKQIQEKLSSLEKDTLLFYLILSENRDHKTYTSQEAAELIAEYASVPCFRLVQPGIDSGLLGGKIVSHEKMGAMAGEMAQQIIDGKSISEIDLVLKSPNLYYINEDVFIKFQIDFNLIPDDAIVINHHSSFFEKNKKVLIVTGVGFSFMLIIILIMLSHNIKKKKLIKELEALTQELNHIAKYDDLTGLTNRRYFIHTLNYLIRCQTKLTLAVFGLDNFKRFNDIFGNGTGNDILRQLTDDFKDMQTEDIHFYRLSGDEFAIIMTCDDQKAESFIKRFMLKMNQPLICYHQKCLLTCSMGIAQYPKDSQNIEELLSYADSAMYTVKKNGKNDYRYYDEKIENEQLKLLEIENILDEALNNNGFQLLYQPLVSSTNGETVSFEALLRLKDFSIRPDRFIPVAEESGLIIPISRWVIKTVVSDLAELKRNGKTLKPISINFSSVQLGDIGLVNYIQNILDEYQIDGKYLEFEVTERVFIKMNKEVEVFFSQLKQLGIRLVLDDFGTGYASIQYLVEFPFHKIKLDKSIIYKFLSLNNRDTLKKLISLIHSLNLQVVGEGVETSQQFKALQDVHCDYIQGYLFEKPVGFSIMCEIFDKRYE